MGLGNDVLLLEKLSIRGIVRWPDIEMKCHANYLLLMPLALPVLYREDCDFDGDDDTGCRVLWTAFHLEGRDAAHMYRYISIRHL